ncbi:transcription factor 21-like [Corticium candelabrum]|uniref:transcription factor 21-like n=1 Tax=Corticium candelabrum TaxID=121492 RepID=UPI002E25EE00|nr:transcription factor 21-like [Corticium candelabrum]
MSGSESDSQLSGSVESMNDAKGAGKRKAKRAQRRGSYGSATAGGSSNFPSSANDRERDRMHSINEAFKCLKESLPFIPPDTKLSKIRTLRYAISYISHLSWELGIAMDGSDVARHAVDWQYGFSIPTPVTSQYAYPSHNGSYTNAVAQDPRQNHEQQPFTLQTDFQTLQQQAACMRQLQAVDYVHTHMK